MQGKRVEIINPYCNDQVEKMNNFCLRQGLPNVAPYLLEIQKSQDEDSYQKSLLLSPIVNRYLAFVEGNEVKDYCTIHEEKDIRRCFLTFPSLVPSLAKRELVSLAVQYIFSNLEVREVFVKMNQFDKKVSSSLKKLGFESLGDEDQEIIYMFSKEEKTREHTFS